LRFAVEASQAQGTGNGACRSLGPRGDRGARGERVSRLGQARLRRQRRSYTSSAAVPAARRARPGEPALAALPRQFGSASKIAFPARDFAAAFGAGLAASSQVTAIIIPSLTDTAGPVTIRRASPAEAQAALSACCFTPADEFRRPWLVARARPDAGLAAHAARRCRQLAASVPCITVSSGTRGPLARFAEALATVTGTAR
jgi:hypothetical protein